MIFTVISYVRCWGYQKTLAQHKWTYYSLVVGFCVHNKSKHFPHFVSCTRNMRTTFVAPNWLNNARFPLPPAVRCVLCPPVRGLCALPLCAHLKMVQVGYGNGQTQTNKTQLWQMFCASPTECNTTQCHDNGKCIAPIAPIETFFVRGDAEDRQRALNNSQWQTLRISLVDFDVVNGKRESRAPKSRAVDRTI